jgi:hypothetical protein
VEWRFIPNRTAETWCMKTCNDDRNCRSEYSCVLPAEINMNGQFEPNLPEDERVARIIDLEGSKAQSQICVALTPTSGSADAFATDGGL